MKINFGKFVSNLLTADVETYLKRMLLESLSHYAPKVGEEVQVGTEHLRLLSEKWDLRILATRKE